MPKEQAFAIRSAASFGPAIRHYRQQAGLTQRELADRSGLNLTYLSKLESGEPSEQVKRILRVLNALNLRIAITADEA